MDLTTGFHIFTKGINQMPDLARTCALGWKLLMIVLGVFWIIVLYDCLKRNFKAPTDKLAWTLVLVFLPILSAFLYVFWIYFGNKKK